MTKTRHEVRDAVHGFIQFNNTEKKIIDSQPFQRLRHIHQLALSYQVYPGATHRRFEHSLGVMEVASRIFDALLSERIPDDVRDILADYIEPEEKRRYWRAVVRMAALLHDIGHLPFSHAAEAELLPEGWNHERLTVEIIRNSEIAQILGEETPPIRVEDVVDVAYSPKDRAKHEPNFVLAPWKAVLNEIITGNTFGADRIDYLLRDSHHAGVAYGRFDPDRLINGLRLVCSPDNNEVVIGLDTGSIHSAEALLLARYFMYTQVYFHDVRRAYDQHLLDFLMIWLPGGKFSSDWRELIKITDNEVLTGMAESLRGDDPQRQELAERIMNRKHFRTVYTLISSHKTRLPTIFEDLLRKAEVQHGAENIRKSTYGPKSESNNFGVVNEDGSVESSLAASGVIANIPAIEIGLIFARQDLSPLVESELNQELNTLLKG